MFPHFIFSRSGKYDMIHTQKAERKKQMNISNKFTRAEINTFIGMTVLLTVFFAFLIFYHVTDMCFYQENSPGCLMKEHFHLYCPGCGGTRALDAFLHGNLITSAMYHPFFVYLLFFFLSYYIPSILMFSGILKKRINYMIYIYILAGLLAVVIINSVVRNLLLVYGKIDYIGECINYWR